MTRLANFELRVVAIDPGEPRERWNGDPMASDVAQAALHEAVAVFEAALDARGLKVAQASYGVTGEIT